MFTSGIAGVDAIVHGNRHRRRRGTSPTLRLRARFIDGKRPSAGVAAVESGDCSIRFVVIGISTNANPRDRPVSRS